MVESVKWGMWGDTDGEAIDAAKELDIEETTKRCDEDDHWRWLKLLMKDELDAAMLSLNMDETHANVWLRKRHSTIPSVVMYALFKDHVTDCPHIFRNQVIEETLRVAEMEGI